MQASRQVGRQLKMTKHSSERLSKADLKFLLNLNKAEEEAQTEIEIDGDDRCLLVLSSAEIDLG